MRINDRRDSFDGTGGLDGRPTELHDDHWEFLLCEIGRKCKSGTSVPLAESGLLKCLVRRSAKQISSGCLRWYGGLPIAQAARNGTAGRRCDYLSHTLREGP